MERYKQIKKEIKWYSRINLLYAIAAIFIITYILHMIYKFHFVLWDEAVYIGIGKYIFSLGKIGLWENIRPLGIPFLFGLVWKLGLNPILWGRIVELIFATGTIFLVYNISKHIFNKQTALFSTIIYAITPVFFYNSLRLMTGIPSTFFILLAIYLFIRKYYVYAGIATSLAFIFRYPNGLVFICCLATLFVEFMLVKGPFKKKIKANSPYLKNAIKYILGFLPLVVASFAFNYYKYKSFLYPFLQASSHGENLVHAIHETISNLFYYPFNLIIQNYFLIFSILGFILTYFILKKSKNIVRDSIIPISLIIFLAYFTYLTNKQLRFSLSFLPFIAILAGYGIYYTIERIRTTETVTKEHWLRILPLMLLLIFSIISITSSLHEDYNSFNKFPTEKPPIVDEYYKFFPDDYKGLILTADPVHVAYSDIKIVPYYDSVEDGHKTYSRWMDNPSLAKEVSAVIFIPGPFVCFNMECEEQLRPALFDKIREAPNNNLKLAFEKKYEEVKSIYYVKD
ncbi:hypothetical protein HOC35_03290 [Candidatus Woesearchaeota archaeon]|jgi:hypothetical protein|nr:hypothetical protein [Candidatus Woesearchaeota archaeon]